MWDQFQLKFEVNITFPFITIFQVNITEDIEKKKLHRLQTKKATFSMQIKGGYANKNSSIFCE